MMGGGGKGVFVLFLLFFFFIEPETRVSTVVIFLFFGTRCFLFVFFLSKINLISFILVFSGLLFIRWPSVVVRVVPGVTGFYRVLSGLQGL